ncbi:hypothetical protein, partial [Pseudomonas sp. MWU16-30323]|uniref:hypothetical protein n=1 Tax=Pseudomonas sp. MWU16-30323 TaxID=2878094 RepID=UPI001CF9C4B8
YAASIATTHWGGASANGCIATRANRRRAKVIFGGGIGCIFADSRAKKMKEGEVGGDFLVQFT